MVAFKIGSGELTNLPFLSYVAAKGKPLILSTGMSNLQEVAAAVGDRHGRGQSRAGAAPLRQQLSRRTVKRKSARDEDA